MAFNLKKRNALERNHENNRKRDSLTLEEMNIRWSWQIRVF
jgi:hypothetical protein